MNIIKINHNLILSPFCKVGKTTVTVPYMYMHGFMKMLITEFRLMY